MYSRRSVVTSFAVCFVVSVVLFGMPIREVTQQASILALVDQDLCGNSLGENPKFVPVDRVFHCTLPVSGSSYYLVYLEEDTPFFARLEDEEGKGSFNIWKGTDNFYGSLRYDYQRDFLGYLGRGSYVFGINPGNSLFPYSFSFSLSRTQLPIPTLSATPVQTQLLSPSPSVVPQPEETIPLDFLNPSPSPSAIPTVKSTIQPSVSTIKSLKPSPVFKTPVPVVTPRPSPTSTQDYFEPVPMDSPDSEVPSLSRFDRFLLWIKNIFGF